MSTPRFGTRKDGRPYPKQGLTPEDLVPRDYVVKEDGSNITGPVTREHAIRLALSYHKMRQNHYHEVWKLGGGGIFQLKPKDLVEKNRVHHYDYHNQRYNPEDVQDVL